MSERVAAFRDESGGDTPANPSPEKPTVASVDRSRGAEAAGGTIGGASNGEGDQAAPGMGSPIATSATSLVLDA